MRILHTMIRVNNLDESIMFYQNFFGMKVIRKQDYPKGKFSLAFIGYGEEESSTVLELTYNWDCLLYTSPSPRDAIPSRMPSSA